MGDCTSSCVAVRRCRSRDGRHGCFACWPAYEPQNCQDHVVFEAGRGLRLTSDDSRVQPFEFIESSDFAAATRGEVTLRWEQTACLAHCLLPEGNPLLNRWRTPRWYVVVALPLLAVLILVDAGLLHFWQ